MSCHFVIFWEITISHLNADLTRLVSVNVFKMTAQNTALGEHLGAVRACIWFSSGVLSQMDSHVAAFGKCAFTTLHQAFECSLVPVCLRVHYSDGLTHLFVDSFEALFLSHIEAFLIRFFILSVLNLLVVKWSWLLSDVMYCLIVGGQNRSGWDSDLFIRNISSTHLIIGICHFLNHGDNSCHWSGQCVQSLNVRLHDDPGIRLDCWSRWHGDVLALCLDGAGYHWLPQEGWFNRVEERFAGGHWPSQLIIPCGLVLLHSILGLHAHVVEIGNHRWGLWLATDTSEECFLLRSENTGRIDWFGTEDDRLFLLWLGHSGDEIRGRLRSIELLISCLEWLNVAILSWNICLVG